MQDTINATIRYNGAVLALNNIVSGSVATNEHGFAEASITARLPRNTRTNSIFHAMSGQAAELVVCCGPDTLYEGRVEMVEIGGNTADFSAVGYQQAYRDVPYTALVCDMSAITKMRPVEAWEIATTTPGKFRTSTTGNRLTIEPIKDSVHATGDQTNMVYFPPYNGQKTITRITFDYELAAFNSGWYAFVVGANEGFTSRVEEWTLTGNSAVQTGSASITLANVRTNISFGLIRSGASTTFALETGERYFRVYNLKVYTTASTTVNADEIVKDIVDYMAGVSASQVNDNTAYIDNPGLSLNDQVYEDMLPADIFNKLCLLGDDQVPPNKYEWQVWENKLLFFRRRGLYNAKWHVVGDDIRIANNNGDIVNSTYATYRDASGRTLRTTVDTEIDASVFQAVLRRQAVQANTTSALQAEVNADAVRYDKRRAQARLQFQLNTAHNITTGYRVPAWRIRSGDTVIVRNIPAATSGLNGVNTFTVLRTEFDIVKRTITITPDNPAPVLEMMLARRDMSRL